jgi:alkylhydroperoxidase family enzyme
MIVPLLDADTTAAAIREAGLSEQLPPVNLMRTLMHNPPVGKIVGDAIDALVFSSVLDARLREIAILRVGWRIGAAYEWGHHYTIAKRIGLSDEEVTAVQTADAGVLSAVERCVVRVVDEVLDGVSVTAETLREAHALLGDDRALLELVMIPGCYRAIGTVLLSFEIPLEDGVAPWPPHGRPSPAVRGMVER